MRFSPLPLSLSILLLDVPSSSASLFPRSIQQAHNFAISHSRNLARDIRTAFKGSLVSQPPSSTNNRVVYCKTKSSGLGGSSGTGNTNGNQTSPTSSHRPNASSTSTKTSSGSKPSATGSVPSSSPWKLLEAHVGLLIFFWR